MSVLKASKRQKCRAFLLTFGNASLRVQNRKYITVRPTAYISQNYVLDVRPKAYVGHNYVFDVPPKAYVGQNCVCSDQALESLVNSPFSYVAIPLRLLSKW